MQKSKEWLLEQLRTIGSSAAGVVAGQSPYQQPVDLYEAIFHARQGIVDPTALTDDMRRGLLTEPLHRQILEEALQQRVHDHDQNRFIYNEQYPWAHALPDGWIYKFLHGESDVGDIPVQLKCPRVRAWHEIRLKGPHGFWMLGSQHSLAVLQKPLEIFSVLNVETMRVLQFPVYRDEKLIDALMELERKFWEDLNAHIRPDSLTATIEMPPANGELVEIDTEEAMRAASAYIAAKEYREEAESLENEARTRIKQLMGPARVADLPGLRCYNTAMPGRKSLDRKAMEKAGIEVEKFETTGKPFEKFTAYVRAGK